jgi:HK97 family phage major capsid protein
MDGTFDAAVTANNYVLLYGDFSENLICDRIGTTMEFIQNVMGANGRPTGQRGAMLWHRSGSDVAVTNAFRLLNIATTA